MPRFLVILKASDPQILTSVNSANAAVVTVYDTAGFVADGDESARATIAGLESVYTTSPVDGRLDTSELTLDGAAAEVVGIWNRAFDADYVAAKLERPRDGEGWDMPGGCMVADTDGGGVA
ncbi:MAG: hypothetical protein M3256_19325 [Actinomycetota bacterium]|nr:hypothetical protein [Actinomycetota bacterium]